MVVADADPDHRSGQAVLLEMSMLDAAYAGATTWEVVVGLLMYVVLPLAGLALWVALGVAAGRWIRKRLSRRSGSAIS
jgi:hypothetical protein